MEKILFEKGKSYSIICIVLELGGYYFHHEFVENSLDKSLTKKEIIDFFTKRIRFFKDIEGLKDNFIILDALVFSNEFIEKGLKDLENNLIDNFSLLGIVPSFKVEEGKLSFKGIIFLL